MDDVSTGVTAGASTAAGDSPSLASADTGGQEAINPTVPSVNGTDPGAPAVAENVSGADAGVEGFDVTEEELQQAPEQWRDKFKSLLGGYKSLEADHKPLKTWIEERGGLEYVQQDAEMVDKLFSSNVEDRQRFYQNLAQDSAAFERILTDFVTDPMVQERALQNMDPQALLAYVERAGLLPQGYGVDIDPAVLATIPNEFQEVFRSLPPGVQEDYGKMSADLRNWNLRRDAQLYNSQKAEQQRQQREQQQYQQQRAQAVQEQKAKVYNDVRSIIQQSLASIFPGNDQATNFVLSATEAALYSSPEGAALWGELESMIDNGQARGLREKLPLIIAKAKAVATQQAQWLNERESKARQFDELMRKASQEEILAYVNQMRGGMKQPSQGTTPQPTNGHVPAPEKVGQYSHENILAYHPLHQRRS